LQYFFTASLAIITAAIFDKLELNWAVVIVAIIGAANAFACYCHWRAYDISMARTAVLSNLDDLLAIALGFAILGELRVLTPILTAGIVVSVISAMIFAKIKHPKDGSSSHLIRWVLVYSSIWGVAIFSMRFFSLQGLSMLTFVAAWYAGAWFGAIFTRFVIMRNSNEAGPPLIRTQQIKVFLLAVAIWTSLMLSYWIRGLVPITVIQPVQLVAEMSIPAIIALIFFGEIRKISRKEIAVIACCLAFCLIGVALIAIGF
jgi:hypothetical protein